MPGPLAAVGKAVAKGAKAAAKVGKKVAKKAGDVAKKAGGGGKDFSIKGAGENPRTAQTSSQNKHTYQQKLEEGRKNLGKDFTGAYGGK